MTSLIHTFHLGLVYFKATHIFAFFSAAANLSRNPLIEIRGRYREVRPIRNLMQPSPSWDSLGVCSVVFHRSVSRKYTWWSAGPPCSWSPSFRLSRVSPAVIDAFYGCHLVYSQQSLRLLCFDLRPGPKMLFQGDAPEGSDTFQWPVIERDRVGGLRLIIWDTVKVPRCHCSDAPEESDMWTAWQLFLLDDD